MVWNEEKSLPPAWDPTPVVQPLFLHYLGSTFTTDKCADLLMFQLRNYLASAAPGRNTVYQKSAFVF
jgi:hypothetical protein